MPNKKNAEKYSCEICDFITSRASNFNTHILTRKHQILTKKMPMPTLENKE